MARGRPSDRLKLFPMREPFEEQIPQQLATVQHHYKRQAEEHLRSQRQNTHTPNSCRAETTVYE